MGLINTLTWLADEYQGRFDHSPEEMIRVEKRLKAKLRMGEADLSPTIINTLLDLHRNHAKELETLVGMDLFSILQDPEDIHVLRINDRPTFVSAELVAFLDAYFKAELLEYTVQCIQLDHYKALHSFLANYVRYFSVALKLEVSDKIIQKLHYCVEVVRLNSMDSEGKLTAVLNPYFFRCINTFGGFDFERSIVDLMGATIEIMGESDLMARIIYSIGLYNSPSEPLDEVLKGNRKWAQQRGVAEVDRTVLGGDPRGGTIIVNQANWGRRKRQNNTHQSNQSGAIRGNRRGGEEGEVYEPAQEEVAFSKGFVIAIAGILITFFIWLMLGK